MAAGSVGKRGPLGGINGPLVKNNFKCLVQDCASEIRGDKLKQHYNTWVDFSVLAEVEHKTFSYSQTKINSIEDEIKRSHTLHFYKSKIFSVRNIPSYKSHKRVHPDLPDPFARFKISKGILGFFFDLIEHIQTTELLLKLGSNSKVDSTPAPESLDPPEELNSVTNELSAAPSPIPFDSGGEFIVFSSFLMLKICYHYCNLFPRHKSTNKSCKIE